MSNAYIPVDGPKEADAYVFATATSAPYQEVRKVGVKDDEAGIPSLAHFEGRTIGDLIGFLSEYPSMDGVVFEDRQILHAQSKSDYVILRLDDRADYE